MNSRYKMDKVNGKVKEKKGLFFTCKIKDLRNVKS